VWGNESDKSQRTSYPFDFLLLPKEGCTKPTLYAKVKATSKKNKDWFLVSREEYRFACLHVNYLILHIHIDEKQQDENKKFRVIEYRNPADEKFGLKLTMTMPEKKEVSIMDGSSK